MQKESLNKWRNEPLDSRQEEAAHQRAAEWHKACQPQAIDKEKLSFEQGKALIATGAWEFAGKHFHPRRGIALTFLHEDSHKELHIGEDWARLYHLA